MTVTSRGTRLDFSESLPLFLHPRALNFTHSPCECKSEIRFLLVSVLAEPQALSACVSNVCAVGALLSHPPCSPLCVTWPTASSPRALALLRGSSVLPEIWGKDDHHMKW